MNIVYLLLPLALLMAAGSACAFIWASSQGQYDDLVTPAHKILLEEENVLPPLKIRGGQGEL